MERLQASKEFRSSLPAAPWVKENRYAVSNCWLSVESANPKGVESIAASRSFLNLGIVGIQVTTELEALQLAHGELQVVRRAKASAQSQEERSNRGKSRRVTQAPISSRTLKVPLKVRNLKGFRDLKVRKMLEVATLEVPKLLPILLARKVW